MHDWLDDPCVVRNSIRRSAARKTRQPMSLSRVPRKAGGVMVGRGKYSFTDAVFAVPYT
jgi:hypothetical protein